MLTNRARRDLIFVVFGFVMAPLLSNIYKVLTGTMEHSVYLYNDINLCVDKLAESHKTLRKHGINIPGEIELKNGFFSYQIPDTRSLNRNYNLGPQSKAEFEEMITVLVYGDSKSTDCLISQLSELRTLFPNILILAPEFLRELVKKDDRLHLVPMPPNEGAALNKFINMVETEFFLYLSNGAVPARFESENGPGWLLHALQSIPELDFVGGGLVKYNSSLKYRLYEIQCYRLNMCRWQFSQSYEYRYSIGDMMVCEETSSSFMGRLSSMRNENFDENLNDLVTTEFFFRMKGKKIIGLRPEVYFFISKICTKAVASSSQKSLSYQKFMDKYDLRQVLDSYGALTEYPNVKRSDIKSIWPKFSHKKHNGFMTPASYRSMVSLLHLVDDFFKKQKNATYFLDGGVILGSVKMRAIMPWDGAADIDTGYYGIKWPRALQLLQQHCPECHLSTGDNSFGGANLRHIEIRQDNGDGAYNELYTHEFEPSPPPSQFLYVYVNGLYIPAEVNFFTVFRKLYGINYLKFADKKGRPLRCSIPGHHACIPGAFSNGGGYWSDFFCRS